MQSNKIGFNNFKAFGPDMQYFSKKPITLVYGPNSVGKSSLLRALLFREYLKSQRSWFSETTVKSTYDDSKSPVHNLLFSASTEAKMRNIKTNMFGDLYDIGNYKSIIHKNELAQEINFDITYTDRDTILSFISYTESLAGYLVGALDHLDNGTLGEVFYILKLKLQLKYTYLKEYDTYKITDFLEQTFLEQLAIKKEDLSKESNVNILEQFIDFTYSQFSIESIRIKTSVNNSMLQEHQVIVEDELLFTCIEVEINPRTYNIELFTNNKAFEKVFFKPESVKLDDSYSFHNVEIHHMQLPIHLYRDFFDLSLNYSEYIESNLRIIIKRMFLTNNNFNNIYIGPIRTIPSRSDLIGIANKVKLQRRKQRLIDNTKRICLKKASLNQLTKKLWWPFYIFCSIKANLQTFNNSIIIRIGTRPIFLKPNSKNALHLWYGLASSRKIKSKINQWLQDKGKHNSSYSIVYDYLTLYFFDESTQTNVHPQDMGVGISQSLPIIIASNLYEDTSIFIEQPELHLHPKLQAEMADEFIKSYKDNSNQFMIETHSEHLLLRIMKRMRYANEDREDRDKTLDLTPDDVCVLYIDSHKGKTFIRELKLDEDGTLLSKWPNGFFEESYNEMFS